jgi:hypothetical protein
MRLFKFGGVEEIRAATQFSSGATAVKKSPKPDKVRSHGQLRKEAQGQTWEATKGMEIG